MKKARWLDPMKAQPAHRVASRSVSERPEKWRAGEQTSSMAPAWARSHQSSSVTRSAYEEIQPPKHYVELTTGGHFTFSDICLLDLETIAAELEIPTGNALADGCADYNISPDDAHGLIRQFGIGFFNHHLRHSPGSATWFDADAAAAHPGALGVLSTPAPP